jgi:hypothetical protein
MGLIKEPKGVDLVVGPSTLTKKDRKMISEIIANYKRTGKLPSKLKKQRRLRGHRNATKNKIIPASRAGY